jgi:hypothetical protein
MMAIGEGAFIPTLLQAECVFILTALAFISLLKYDATTAFELRRRMTRLAPLADATNGLFDLVCVFFKPLIKRYSRRRS